MSAAFKPVKGLFAAVKSGPKPATGEDTDELFGPAGGVEGMHVDARPIRPAVPPDAPHRTGGDTAEVAVTGVGLDGDDWALDVLAPSGSRRVRVPAAFAKALRGRTADLP